MEDFIVAMELAITKSGMKKKDVARKMGVPERKLSDVLHRRNKIDVPIIRKFCVAVGVTPDELFEYKQ